MEIEYLSDIPIIEVSGDNGLNIFIEQLKNNNPSVQGIDLINAYLTSKQKYDLANAIRNNTYLKILIIQSVVDIYLLCKSLKFNDSIQELYLDIINPNELKFISDALKINKSLRFLNISETNIDLEGIKEFSISLKINKTLKEIELKNNGITDEGAIYLANALRYNSVLQKMDVTENPICNDLMNLINQLITINKSGTINHVSSKYLNNQKNNLRQQYNYIFEQMDQIDQSIKIS